MHLCCCFHSTWLSHADRTAAPRSAYAPPIALPLLASVASHASATSSASASSASSVTSRLSLAALTPSALACRSACSISLLSFPSSRRCCLIGPPLPFVDRSDRIQSFSTTRHFYLQSPLLLPPASPGLRRPVVFLRIHIRITPCIVTSIPTSSPLLSTASIHRSSLFESPPVMLLLLLLSLCSAPLGPRATHSRVRRPSPPSSLTQVSSAATVRSSLPGVRRSDHCSRATASDRCARPDESQHSVRISTTRLLPPFLPLGCALIVRWWESRTVSFRSEEGIMGGVARCTTQPHPIPPPPSTPRFK